MFRRTIGLIAATLVSGCIDSGPPTTHTTSSGLATLAERKAFLERYVTFRRTYETLDFDVSYLNNSGMVPAPSEWDIRLIAIVPDTEIAAWILKVAASGPPDDLSWLKTVPTTLSLSGVNEWYVDGGKTVGVDRAKRIVVYRLFTS